MSEKITERGPCSGRNCPMQHGCVDPENCRCRNTCDCYTPWLPPWQWTALVLLLWPSLEDAAYDSEKLP